MRVALASAAFAAAVGFGAAVQPCRAVTITYGTSFGLPNNVYIGAGTEVSPDFFLSADTEALAGAAGLPQWQPAWGTLNSVSISGYGDSLIDWDVSGGAWDWWLEETAGEVRANVAVTIFGSGGSAFASDFPTPPSDSGTLTPGFTFNRVAAQ